MQESSEYVRNRTRKLTVDYFDSIGTRRLVTGLIISGIGIATTIFHLLHLLSELGEPLAILSGVLPPMIISLGLIAGGGWLIRSDIKPVFDRWIIAWTVSGIVAVTATGWFVTFYQAAHGTMLTDTLFMYANWVATGALGGFILGIYDVRRQAAQRELRLERDRLADKERALAHENERLEAFASVVSHDLRNPLNVAQGYMELLREDPDESTIEAVENALDRMAIIIDDVLTMAREGGEVTAEDLSEVRLSRIAESCWEMVASSDATLEVNGEFKFRADEDRLRHVFENLYRNAIDHAGPSVTISMGPLDGRTGFYIADDGPGIETNDDIFEAGYSTDPDGTGLGLAIVETIVRAHGWDIEVTESEAGGPGLRLQISTRIEMQSDSGSK